MQNLFNGIKLKVHFMGNKIKLTAKGFGSKPVRKRLRFFDITKERKRVTIHLKGAAVFIKDTLHHFPPINIKLNQEQELVLKFYMHKSKLFIKIIKIIVLAFVVYRMEGQQSVILLYRLEGLEFSKKGKIQMRPSKTGFSRGFPRPSSTWGFWKKSDRPGDA